MWGVSSLVQDDETAVTACQKNSTILTLDLLETIEREDFGLLG